MSIWKRGKVYWYKFTWHGELIRHSTKQGNAVVARQMEAAHRTALAKGEVGIRERKPVPTLREFFDDRFEPWAKSTFEKSCPGNWLWYRAGIRALLRYKPLAGAKLDSVGNELAAEFTAFRQAEGRQVSTINSALRVLRSSLARAVEWGVLNVRPKVSMLPGERKRETVVTAEQEQIYLQFCSELLRNVAVVLIDTGMRPDECYRMRWENIDWKDGNHGTVLITHGKTAAAVRTLYQTTRMRFTLETLWEIAGKPSHGWVWPAPTKSGHIDHSSLKKQHARAFREANAHIKAEAKKANQKPKLLKPWVLYSFRHTFLTRLGKSGCNIWTHARLAGHSSIEMSLRYVHMDENAAVDAISSMAGHKIGHSAQNEEIREETESMKVEEGNEVTWRARRDSNSRPIAPEAIALSN